MKRFPNVIIIYVTAFVLLFQSLSILQAGEIVLPKPGTLVGLSAPFNPPILKGIKVFPDDPFRLDFVLSQGDSVETPFMASDLKAESTKLIKYFLAALTIPEKDLWVNLSPYETDRIVPESFGQTQMGRDLLAEDYMLKQITASLMYPENKTGKQFWQRIYEEAAKKYGSLNIPVNTFNKVWIVPNKATIYENIETGTAYVVESSLKVMLEADYLAVKKTAANQATQEMTVKAPQGKQHSQVQIVKEIVIPQLTKEINTGKNFVELRQIYNSFILATWYKNKIQQGILHEVYNNQNKVKGIRASKDLNVKQVYDNYLNSFKKGAYNFIKEEKDPITQKIYPRKYFSGGVNLINKNNIVKGVHVESANNAALAIVKMRLDYDDNAMSVMPVIKDNLKDLVGYFTRVVRALKTRNVKEETKVLDDDISQRIFELAWKPIINKLDLYRKPLLKGKESNAFRNNTFWFSVMYRFAQLEVAEGGWFLLPTLNDLANRLKNGVDHRVSEIKRMLEISRKIYLLNASYDPSKKLVIIIRGAYAPPKFYGNFYLAVKDKYNVAYLEYNEFSRVENESLNFLRQLDAFFLEHHVTGKYAIYTHSHGGVIADYAKRIAINEKNPIFKDHEHIALAPVLGGSTKALVYNNFLIRNILLRFFDGNISLLEAHYPNGFIQQELFKEAVLESISRIKKGMMISAPDDPHNVSNDKMQQEIFRFKMEGFKDIRIVFAGHQEIANHPEAVLYAMQHLELVLNDQPEIKAKTGGIDLDARQMAISMQNDSKGIHMTFDPLLIEQLKHVAGFRPTIIGIEPFKKGEAGSIDLRLFLGLP